MRTHVRGRHQALGVRRHSSFGRVGSLAVCFVLFTSSISFADNLQSTSAHDDSAVLTAADEFVVVDVLSNDSVADGGYLVVTSVSSPSHGTAAITDGGLAIRYSSVWCLDDTFSYTVADGLGTSATATVSVSVSCEPAGDEPDEFGQPNVDLATAETLIVRFAPGSSAATRAEVIAANGAVETGSVPVLGLHIVAVAPENLADAAAGLGADPSVSSVDLDREREAGAFTSDPGYANQWALPLIGFEEVYGTINPTGTAVLAVLDTGVDASLGDLAGRVTSGWSFDGSDPTSDPHGHGTHVASIAAAGVDDGVGIAGVGYAGVTVMPVKVLGADAAGTDSDIIEGLVWSVQNGADVIVMAFSNPGESAALQYAVDYAWASGVVVIAAAGNDGSTSPTYPAGLGKVVGVGATDATDTVWSSSNKSAAVFMTAPGVGISSSIGTVTGTSASAAMVAGAAAVMRANDPSAAASTIVGRLARNAEPVSGISGNGRLHLARAVTDTSTTGVTPAAAPGGGPIVGPYVADNHGSSVGCSPAAITVGESSICTASVTGGTPGQPSSGRTVTFTSSLGGSFAPTPECVTAGNNATASCSRTFTPSAAGTHVITASSGSGGHGTGATFGLQVSAPADQETTTAPSPASATYGGAVVTLNATVTPSVNAGTVTFTVLDGATVIGSVVSGTVAAGAASVTFPLGGVDAGNYTIEADYSGATGYEPSSGSAALQIDPKGITGSFTAEDKDYDRTTTATVVDYFLGGVVAGDAVQLSGGAASFVSAPAGESKIVTLTGAFLTGGDAANYSLLSVADTEADITPLDITGAFTAEDKPYDGTSDAAVTDRSLVGVLGDDDVSLSAGTATFDNKNVGTNKTVTLTGATLAGVDAGNYNLTAVATTTADITALGVTISFTADDKIYNADVDATILSRQIDGGVLLGDTVGISGGTATFDDENVGTAKSVTASGFVLTGADADNYSIQTVVPASADITALAISGSFTAANKAYDGDNDAEVTDRTLTGTFEGDEVTLAGGTATFDNEDVGNSKTVTLTGATLSGGDALNYTLSGVATATADISPLGITGSFTAADKVYDGDDLAVVLTHSLHGQVLGDAVDLSWDDATFTDKNVGNGKIVTLNGAILTGDDAGNYTLDSVATTTADITPLDITGTFTAADKDYDGLVDATVTGRDLVGAVGTDVVELDGGTASFGDRHAAAGKTVTLTGAVLIGLDAGNYTLTGVATTAATISPLEVTGTFTADDKIYDGDTDADVIGSSVDPEFYAIDTVILEVTNATFADKNIGDDKTVTADLALTGADAGNYTLAFLTATATADISPLGITGSFTAADKVYDGDDLAVVLTHSLHDHVLGDDVSLSWDDATFTDKNVGNGKIVTLNGAILTGDDAGNYTLDSVATTTADITPLDITGTFTAADKVWDDSTDAEVLTRSLPGKIGDDDLTLVGGAAAFASSLVGTWTVELTGATLAGVDAGNYTLTSVATTTATITTAFRIEAFFQPVDMTRADAAKRTYNSVKGGQTVPLKFRVYELDGTEVTTTAGMSIKVLGVTCATGTIDEALLPADATGGTSLRYSQDQFIFNWSVPKKAAYCYQVVVQTVDGSTVIADTDDTTLEAYFRSK